jgi:exopolyphosphatase/pppGpp-phosphohydrolase
MKKKLQILGFIFTLLLTVNTYSQSIYAGIEIGGKGVKVSIIKIIDLQVGEFEVVKTWSRNTNITKNVDKDGNLDKTDIDDTSYVVLDLMIQIKREYKITDPTIFIVASSSVATATNREILKEKVKSLTTKNLDFMTSDVESKLIIKGAIPQRDYLNSVILDVGSGSIKGGVIELDKNRTYAFSPFGTKFGTTNLTEKIKNKIGASGDDKSFTNEMVKFQDSLSITMKKMFDNVPMAKDKENVYIIGGAAWAFMTLTKPDETEAYQPFLQRELLAYSDNLLNHYDEFIKKDYVNKEYEHVLKAFNKENLISGCMLMNQLAANMVKPAQKKYYFVRQGQVAWLIAYIVDVAREKK